MIKGIYSNIMRHYYRLLNRQMFLKLLYNNDDGGRLKSSLHSLLVAVHISKLFLESNLALYESIKPVLTL